MDEGYIYVAFNPEMPHCLKVGLTTRLPGKRIAELSGTSTPVPFRLMYQWRVTDTRAAERAAHEALSDKRVSSKREFFRVEGPDAFSIIGNAIKPYLVSTVGKAIRDRIDEECRAMARFLFAHDLRSDTPVSPAVTESLQSQLRDRVVSLAEQANEDGTSPEVVFSVMDLVVIRLEGPAQYHLSPIELAKALIDGMDVLMSLLWPDVYLMCGVNTFGQPALKFSAALSSVIAHSMRLENEENPVIMKTNR